MGLSEIMRVADRFLTGITIHPNSQAILSPTSKQCTSVDLQTWKETKYDQ